MLFECAGFPRPARLGRRGRDLEEPGSGNGSARADRWSRCPRRGRCAASTAASTAAGRRARGDRICGQHPGPERPGGTLPGHSAPGRGPGGHVAAFGTSRGEPAWGRRSRQRPRMIGEPGPAPRLRTGGGWRPRRRAGTPSSMEMITPGVPGSPVSNWELRSSDAEPRTTGPLPSSRMTWTEPRQLASVAWGGHTAMAPRAARLRRQSVRSVVPWSGSVRARLRWLPARGRGARQWRQAGFGYSAGRSTGPRRPAFSSSGIKPNISLFSMRSGYRTPSRWSHSCCTTRA